VVSNTLNTNTEAYSSSAYLAYLCGMWKDDRRDSNPRPSEPQSVSASPALSWHILVCGLDKPKTRPSRGQTYGCVLASIAAALLPYCAITVTGTVPHSTHLGSRSECFSLNLRPRAVLAQLVLWYFCLPDVGVNGRPQPGHSLISARVTMSPARWA
jgi:hypothetical protein